MERRNEVDFLFADNIKLPYKLTLPILKGMASYAQSTQNNKFAKYL